MSSMKDVAKIAGVSIATVSRVLNGNYPVKEATHQSVLAAMKELNYYPNEVARSLKNDSSTHTIGFVVSDISNAFFTSIAKAVEDAISPMNYNIIVCSTENRKDRELSYLKMLMSKKVDGLVLNTTGENDDTITQISQHLPIVLIERRVTGENFVGDYIANDNQMAIRLLTTHLLHRKHTRIGVINGPRSASSARERYLFFRMEMEKAGITIPDDYSLAYEGNFSSDSGYAGAERLFSQEEKPTALIIMNNSMTVGALKYFHNRGINVPGDVSIVSYGDIENADLFYVRPTHSTLSSELLGVKAAEMLFSRLGARGISNREAILVAQLVTGDTVKSL